MNGVKALEKGLRPRLTESGEYVLNIGCICDCVNVINAGFLMHLVNQKKEPEVIWKDTFTQEKRLKWVQDPYLWGVEISCMNDFICFDFDSEKG